MTKSTLEMGTKVEKVPFNIYPRRDMIRDSYISLNGEWDKGIIVPFPPQSKNSNYKKHHVPEEFTYKRNFKIPKEFIRDKIILHFDAVDQIAEVYIDGKYVGHHAGGYTPFSFDITSFIVPDETHSLRVRVVDHLSHIYPYGKQRRKRGGMWYTPISGIWQSVWIESVWEDYIKDVKIKPDLKGIDLKIDSEAAYFDVQILYPSNSENQKVVKTVRLSKYMDSIDGFIEKRINIDSPKLWTPEEPNLYDLKIRAFNALDGKSYDDIVKEGFSGDGSYDSVKCYFGLRTLSIKTVKEKKRILLNGKPYFFHGVLDQGYFPEGIYTPNCEKDYYDDVRKMKELGFNTIRKHIKVEPTFFYEACDRIGMIVWQDMVNNGKYSFIRDTALANMGKQKKDDRNRPISHKTKRAFIECMEETINRLYNFTSVCYYTIFNEGWGQFDSDKMYEIVKALDDTRILDSTSGWFWQDKSDVDSFHVYYHPVIFEESNRPVVVSEFGGYSLPIDGHKFNEKSSYGYDKAKEETDLTYMIEKLYVNEVFPEIKRGLCGSIYTQFTDVEDESNGFYTYDRQVLKVNLNVMKEIGRKLRDHYEDLM
ncbi:MAG: glycoside hydrolase family 2 [Lachnospiraceae bacterium]|nr:glycoside hydrolase family 2 [Lachnospiraceae bacterium]